jgi:hypothetical protein
LNFNQRADLAATSGGADQWRGRVEHYDDVPDEYRRLLSLKPVYFLCPRNDLFWLWLPNCSIRLETIKPTRSAAQIAEVAHELFDVSLNIATVLGQECAC